MTASNISTPRRSSDALSLPHGLTLHRPAVSIRIEDLARETQGRMLTFADLLAITQNPIENKRVDSETIAKVEPPLPRRKHNPLADPAMLEATQKEELAITQWINKKVKFLSASDPNDTRKKDRILGEIEYYLRTTCEAPLLTFAEERTIGKDIEMSHEQWSTALLSIPVVQSLAFDLIRQCIKTGRHRQLLDEEQSGEDLQTTDRFIQTLSREWKSLNTTQRTERLVQLGIKNRWMENVMKAASSLQKMADSAKNFDTSLLAKGENVLMKRIGSRSAGKILPALHGIDNAEKWHTVWVNAKQRLCLSNMRLCVAIAAKHQHQGLPLTDLISEGSIGLMRATELFDHSLGWKFSTYATWWIRRGITRELQGKSRTVRVPSNRHYLARDIAKASQRITQEAGHKLSDGELSEALMQEFDITMKELADVRRGYVSIDKPIGNGDATLGDLLLKDQSMPAPAVATDQHALREKIKSVLQMLSYRDREVIKMRYGLGDGHPYTLIQCQRVFGVTRERIRQIEAHALGKLNLENRRKLIKPFVDDLPFVQEKEKDL